MTNARYLFTVICVLALSAIGFAYYLQIVGGLFPCDLCMLQRFSIFAIALTSLVAVIHRAKPLFTSVYALMLLSFSLIGTSFSLRQIYLQNLPEDLKPSCGAGLMHMLQNDPWLEALRAAISGSGDCAQVQWVFLGQSLPFWTGILFIVMGLLSACALVARK